MGKQKEIGEIAGFIAFAALHKIASLLNPSAIYAEKYRKEYTNFVKQAEHIFLGKNWNMDDKDKIRAEAQKQAHNALQSRDYIEKKKFKLLDREITEVLEELK